MFSKTQIDFFGTPKLKKIGREKMDKLIKQATRHNTVCSVHPPARCCWIFMTPLLYDAFTARLAFEILPTITTVYVPTTLLK